MQRGTTTICNLCGKNRKLEHSHILPELLYLPMYDEKHRAIEVTSDADKREQYIQKGLRENLLCGECEAKLSRYEKYAAPIIKSIPGKLPEPGGILKVIQPVNYPRFKLFQMSLLWRSSVATNPAFNAVRLGEHQELMRQMLDKDNPGRSDDYGCLMVTIRNVKHLDKMMFSPVSDIVHGQQCYRFFTPSIFWYFFLPNAYPPICRDFFLSEAGTLTILVASWSEEQITQPLRDMLTERAKNQTKDRA